jgi:hypothetical protein
MLTPEECWTQADECVKLGTAADVLFGEQQSSPRLRESGMPSRGKSNDCGALGRAAEQEVTYRPDREQYFPSGG